MIDRAAKKPPSRLFGRRVVGGHVLAMAKEHHEVADGEEQIAAR